MAVSILTTGYCGLITCDEGSCVRAVSTSNKPTLAETDIWLKALKRDCEKQGWHIGPDGQCLCPEHAPKEGEDG